MIFLDKSRDRAQNLFMKSFVIACIAAFAVACASAPVSFEPSGTITASTGEPWGEVIHGGLYRVQSNTWNAARAGAGSSQRVFLQDVDGREAFGWSWDWRNAGTDYVLAQPQVIFGLKPWEARAGEPLPWTQRADEATLEVDFRARVRATGVYNMAFTVWAFADAARPKESIANEIMIWNDARGLVPAGSLLGIVEIDGREWRAYARRGHVDDSGSSDQKWTYVAFQAVEPFHEGTLRVRPFLDYLVSRGLLAPTALFSSIEWGNEVVRGRGIAEVDEYAVRLR